MFTHKNEYLEGGRSCGGCAWLPVVMVNIKPWLLSGDDDELSLVHTHSKLLMFYIAWVHGDQGEVVEGLIPLFWKSALPDYVLKIDVIEWWYTMKYTLMSHKVLVHKTMYSA